MAVHILYRSCLQLEPQAVHWMLIHCNPILPSGVFKAVTLPSGGQMLSVIAASALTRIRGGVCLGGGGGGLLIEIWKYKLSATIASTSLIDNLTVRLLEHGCILLEGVPGTEQHAQEQGTMTLQVLAWQQSMQSCATESDRQSTCLVATWKGRPPM